MRARFALYLALAFAGALSVSAAEAACGDPDALGDSRVLQVDTTGGPAYGTMQHKRLPLADMEVVLTFDDGPFPGATDKVLDALRDACVHATFFTVGRMAKAYPEVLRREAAEGHTIGTHSWSHPPTISALPYTSAVRQIDRGVAAVTAALGRQPAPFFRFPGLGETRALRKKLADDNVAIFSADVVGADWTGISADAIRRTVLNGLRRHRGGIVLLHDIKKATARMLPELLRDLKAEGYKVVRLVPAPGTVLVVDPSWFTERGSISG